MDRNAITSDKTRSGTLTKKASCCYALYSQVARFVALNVPSCYTNDNALTSVVLILTFVGLFGMLIQLIVFRLDISCAACYYRDNKKTGTKMSLGYCIYKILRQSEAVGKRSGCCRRMSMVKHFRSVKTKNKHKLS